MARIQANVEKMLDRGPHYGFLEVQVNFEEKTSPPTKNLSLAYVIISLPKAEVGGMPFDDIRKMALDKAVSFLKECAKSVGDRS